MRTLIDFDAGPVFAIPMAGGSLAREGVLIEGPQGWGEFSPPPGADPDEDLRWLTAAVEGGTVGWPDPARGRVRAAVTVPAVSAAQARDIVGGSRWDAADVTVGTGLDEDSARLRAVHDTLGPGAVLRCDAAGRWDAEAAVAAITALHDAVPDLQFVRQPCRTAEETLAVRRRVQVPIAVDAWRVGGGAALARLREIADIAVVAVGPLGGVRRALRVAETAALPTVVASSVETSVGLAGGVALAGALPPTPLVAALGTTGLLAGDVVAPARRLRAVDGRLPVSPMPPAPDPGELARWAADPATVARWRARLRAAAHRLD